MTQAKIAKQDGYRCAPEGATVQTFAFGQIVEGNVAEWAIADGAAQRMFEPREETKVEVVPETKQRGRPRKEPKK